jgi:uncharacterized oxidoreductase
MPTISAEVLTKFATDLLHAGGLSSKEAAVVGTSLVEANLRGHDSHGVMRIPQYLDAAAKKEVVASAPFTVVKETSTSLMVDGNWGFGQTQAQELTRRVIEKAKKSGLAVGTLIHSSHVGRLGEYCEMGTAVGLVSMAMVNTHGAARRVAPPGGKVARLGTNPIAFGVPHGDTPLILDFGTCATAEGKVRVKKIAGQKCPDGWLIDSEGRPTNNPNDLYATPPGSILPMGGDQSYKGFGLGMMVEVFAGALSGGVCIREKPANQNGNCMFFMAIDPQALGGAGHFQGEVDGLCDFVKNCPTIDANGEIMLPGDPERKTLATRSKGGIPLDDGNWAELTKLAAKLNVPLPAI